MGLGLASAQVKQRKTKGGRAAGGQDRSGQNAGEGPGALGGLGLGCYSLILTVLNMDSASPMELPSKDG